MESKKDLLPHELIFLIHQELCRNMTENDDLDLTVQCIAMASWNWFLQNRK